MSDFEFGFGQKPKPVNPGGGNDGDGLKIGAGVIGVVVALVLAGFVLFSSFVIVQPGTLGVVTQFGAVQDEILPEGLHVVMPIKTKVIPIDVRVQKLRGDASASSKDLQIVTSGVVLNYYLEKTKVNEIFQQLGTRYQPKIIDPAIQESVKAATAKFNAERLITQRQEVKEAIFEDLKMRLEKYGIIVKDLSITDFNFSSDFNKAIEDKQVAEQRALRALNDLERIKTEAAQARVKAEGQAQAKIELARAEAESQRLQRQTLNDRLIQLRAIEKWDGHLPTVNGGGATPFISMDNLVGKR